MTRFRTEGQAKLHKIGAAQGRYLAHVVVYTPTRHELEDYAEVGLARAGSNELDHVLVSHLAHDCHFLHTPGNLTAQACATTPDATASLCK